MSFYALLLVKLGWGVGKLWVTSEFSAHIFVGLPHPLERDTNTFGTPSRANLTLAALKQSIKGLKSRTVIGSLFQAFTCFLQMLGYRLSNIT